MMWWLALGLFLVVGLVWLLVLLLHGPLWIAIAVTATLFVAFMLVLVVRRVRASLRAAALERELLRAAAQQAANVRPDRRNEVLALQTRMKEAIGALKRTKLGARGGNAALYALPWYVIVGPPQAGKTTALVQSNLGFITPPGGAGGGKVRGTAGTRNCDWWFSEQAILLDTAGRFTTGEDDREEWLGFLDLLRRFRPKQPLDGVVMALSCEDLLAAGEYELEELAKNLRSRADEVMERLEMVLPVYVMLTKVDLVAGFVEFWGDLGKAQRGQTWGATFELSDELAEPGRAVEAEFERLEQVLYARMLQRLNGEPLAEVRARVLQFPLEFAAIRAPLASLVELLCRSNPYQETPLLRGFYLTSGTQTGRALDRVLDKMARGFNVPLLQGPAAMRSEQPQSYFVTELFQRVIFPDRHLAVRSRSRLRRGAIRQVIQAAIVALVVLALVIPAAASYVQNSGLVHDTARDVARSVELEKLAGSDATAAALDTLVGRVQTLEQAAGDFSIHGYLGPYAAPELLKAVKGVYLSRLRTIVQGPVRAELLTSVTQAGSLSGVGQIDSQNFQQAYEDLKLYLMLTRPEHLAPEWAAPALAKVWARSQSSAAPSDPAKLAAHARYFVTQLAADKTWALPIDEVAVARAQGSLSAVPVDELRYGWLLEAAKGAPPIRADSIFLGPAARYSQSKPNVEVPGVYTALGWQKVRSLVESPDSRFELEPWVLGQVGAADADTKTSAADRLKALYFQRYSRAWFEFIGGLGVAAPGDLQGSIEELQALSVDEGPYTRLFNVIGENVRLDVTPPQTLADLAKAKVAALANSALSQVDAGIDGGAAAPTVSPPEREFQPILVFAFGDSASGKASAAPPKLGQYLMQLNNLQVNLSALAESKTAPAQQFDALLEQTQISVKATLTQLDPRTYRVLEPLLMNPIRGSRAGVMRADFTQLSDHWKTEVWDPLHDKILPRYPFADVPAEVSIADLTEFFRPDAGLVWKFYADNLATRLDRSGNRFAAKAAADALPFRPDFLECLGVAADITDAMFGTAAVPAVHFDVQMHPAGADVAEISLIVDGHATTYRNEPERWMPVDWPGKEGPHGATLQVRGAGFTDEIPRVGDFGLFRLFDAGGVKAASGATLSGTWSLTRPGEPPVSIDIRPAKSMQPFVRGFFRRLKCPPVVTTVAAAGPG